MRQLSCAFVALLAAGPVSGGEGGLSREDLAAAEEFLRSKVIEAVEGGREIHFYVDLFGQAMRAKLVGADEEGVTAEVMGAPVQTRWEALSAKRFYGLAARCADEDSAADHAQLGRYALGNGLKKRAETNLQRAVKLDPGLKEKLAPLLAAFEEDKPRPPSISALLGTERVERQPRTKPKPKRPSGVFAPKVYGWEPSGLSGGGAMYTPAISPADPDVMVVNCDMSGAYISTDGGKFWKLFHHRRQRSSTRCRPAFHPTDPRTLYSASGWGGRVKVTRDGGETWEAVGNVGSRLFGEIYIDQDNPALMLAGTAEGVSLSRNGGGGWKKCDGPHGEAIAFHVDRTSPVQSRVVFAATKQGIWRSDDNGVTWTEKTNGLPSKEVLSFAGGSEPKTRTIMLYCSVQARAAGGKYQGGVFRSRDRGETWESAMGKGINKDTKSADQYAQGPVAQYPCVLGNNVRPRTVYAMNTSTGFWPPHHPTVFRSDDAGDTWRATMFLDQRFSGKYNVAPNYHTANAGQSYQEGVSWGAMCATDPDRVVRVGGMRCFITHDGGNRWFNGHTHPAPGQEPRPGSMWICNGLVVTSTWNYYVDPFQHKRHYIAYTDIGFARSLDGGNTWTWWEPKKSAPWRNTCYELAFDPGVPGKAWGAFTNVHDIPNGNIIHNRHWAGNPERGGGGIVLSTDFCESWKHATKGLPDSPATSVVLDPKSPPGARTLYAGMFGKGVYKSADDGKTWTKKSSGLGHSSNMRVCRVVLHKDGTLFALITARQVGSGYTGFRKEGVGLYRSKDAAESWKLITKDPVLLWPKDFNVHPENSLVIFIGAADADGRQGGLYRTTDGGAHWSRVVRKSSQHFGAYFHPKRPGWIYMTMCEGAQEWPLYLSTDGGGSWKGFESFPFSNAQRVCFDPDDPAIIYVTTFGGSVFRGPAAGR